MNTENNKIIAEFMDFKLNPEIAKDIYINSDKKSQMYISQMLYHSDWNWLMEVIQKIGSLGYEVLIGNISCQTNKFLDRQNPISGMVCGDVSKKMEITYEAIVQFIKWYKENK